MAVTCVSTPDRIKTLLSSFGDPKDRLKSLDIGIPENSTSSSIALLCQDKQAFLDRVQTYKPLSWLAKPITLSPLQCARYGWQNVDVDVLQCVTCHTYVSGHLPLLGDNVQVYEACRDRLLRQLREGHHLCCSWANNPSPEHFLRVPEINPEEAVSAFRQRARVLCGLEMQLPSLNQELLEDMGLSSRLLRNISAVGWDPEADVPANVAQASAVLALCGWKRRSQSSISTIHCEYCQRDVGLWNFHGLGGYDEPQEDVEESDEAGDDPVEEEENAADKGDGDGDEHQGEEVELSGDGGEKGQDIGAGVKQEIGKEKIAEVTSDVACVKEKGMDRDEENLKKPGEDEEAEDDDESGDGSKENDVKGTMDGKQTEVQDGTDGDTAESKGTVRKGEERGNEETISGDNDAESEGDGSQQSISTKDDAEQFKEERAEEKSEVSEANEPDAGIFRLTDDVTVDGSNEVEQQEAGDSKPELCSPVESEAREIDPRGNSASSNEGTPQKWQHMDYRSKSPSDNDSDSVDDDDNNATGLPQLSHAVEDNEQENNTSPVKNIRPRFPVPSGAGSQGYVIRSPAKRPLPFDESSENEEGSEDSSEEHPVRRREWQRRRKYSESESEEEKDKRMNAPWSRTAPVVVASQENADTYTAGDTDATKYRSAEADSDSDVSIYNLDGAADSDSDCLTYSVDGPPDGRPGEGSDSDDEVLIVDSDDEEEVEVSQERPESPESPEEEDDYYSEEESGSEGERSYSGEESGDSPDVVAVVESDSEGEQGEAGLNTSDASHRGEHTLEESNSNSALHWTEATAIEEDSSSLARQELWEGEMAGEEHSFMMERGDLHSLAMQTAQAQSPSFPAQSYSNSSSLNSTGYTESYNATSHNVALIHSVSSENSTQLDTAVGGESSAAVSLPPTLVAEPTSEFSQERSDDEVEEDNSADSVVLNDSNYSSDEDAEAVNPEVPDDSLSQYAQHQLSSIAEENSEELEEPDNKSLEVPEENYTIYQSEMETAEIDLDTLQGNSCSESVNMDDQSIQYQANTSASEVSLDTTGHNTTELDTSGHDTTGVSLSAYAGLLDSSTETASQGHKRRSEDAAEEECRAAKRANLRKQHFFHPVEEHKAFCPWVVEASRILYDSPSDASNESRDQETTKGWQRLLAMLQQYKTPQKSAKSTPTHDNLRKLRKILNDWSSPQPSVLNVT